MLCHALLCYTMLYYAILCYAITMLYYAMLLLCYIMLYYYYAMLCYTITMLCHAILCYALLHKTVTVIRSFSVMQKFSGSLEAMIRSANGDAWSLVEVVAGNFSSYRDVTSYNGQAVSLLKRAQLIVSDLSHVLGGRSFGALSGIEKLTMFADYRVPQVR